MDHPHSVALVQPQPDKINVSPTKTALHRTRLRVLHHKNFSVLFFYKPIRLSALLLAFCRSSATENFERDFIFFIFVDLRWTSIKAHGYKIKVFFQSYVARWIFYGSRMVKTIIQ